MPTAAPSRDTTPATPPTAPTFEQVRDALLPVLHQAIGEDLGDHRFYDQAAWRAREEPFGNTAICTLVAEGPIYDLMNDNAFGGLGPVIRVIEGLGCVMELGYSWSLHVFPPRPRPGA